MIGQPDFETRTPGRDRKKFGGGKLIVDSKNQRLFVSDGQGSQVLVFDIHPDRLKNYPEAFGVIGQP